jgi:hypothetical protein
MDVPSSEVGKTFPLLEQLKDLERTRDLWAALWDAREKEAFERALLRVVAGDGPRRLRLEALAACHILATPAMLETAQLAIEEGWFTDAELDWIAAQTVPLYRLHKHARELRGHRAVVQFFIQLHLDEPGHPLAGPLLDVIDLCDLYLVGQMSPRPIALEAARRILSRGEHQCRRLAHSLGIALEDLPAAVLPDDDDDDEDYLEYSVQ